MSRSFKHTFICGRTKAGSAKTYKQHENRRQRRSVNQHLAVDKDDSLIPHPRKWGNMWSDPRDGKTWIFGNADWVYHLLKAQGITYVDRDYRWYRRSVSK